MRNVSFVLLILLSGASTSCTDDGAPPPPPPWDSWARVPISADLSIGVHPNWWVTHAYNPAETTNHSTPYFSIARRGVSVGGYRSDYSVTYLPSLPANLYCRFQTTSGYDGGVSLTDRLSSQLAQVYLQTSDHQRYRSVITFSVYDIHPSSDWLAEVVLMARSIECR